MSQHHPCSAQHLGVYLHVWEETVLQDSNQPLRAQRSGSPHPIEDKADPKALISCKMSTQSTNLDPVGKSCLPSRVCPGFPYLHEVSLENFLPPENILDTRSTWCTWHFIRLCCLLYNSGDSSGSHLETHLGQYIHSAWSAGTFPLHMWLPTPLSQGEQAFQTEMESLCSLREVQSSQSPLEEYDNGPELSSAISPYLHIECVNLWKRKCHISSECWGAEQWRLRRKTLSPIIWGYTTISMDL